MSRQLVPIKVKIGLRPNGHADYPDFNCISAAIRHDLDWSRYVDVYGAGWHYDKGSGHKEETSDSPFGQQWGVLIVPSDFAESAVTEFNGLCTKLTEAELEDFYDNKAHAHEPDEIIDDVVLNGINAKKMVGAALTDSQNKALDPNDPMPGIRKNRRKKWADFKELTGIEIKE